MRTMKQLAVLDLRRLSDSLGLKTAWPYEYKRIPIANAEMEVEFGDMKNRLFDYTINYSENLRLITNDKKLIPWQKLNQLQRVLR